MGLGPFLVWRDARIKQKYVLVVFLRKLVPLRMKWNCAYREDGGMSHSS